MQQATSIEEILKRDRVVVVLAGILGIVALAWAYTVYVAWGMKDTTASMDMSATMAMPQMQPWTTVDFVLMFVMWAVMMMAMMVPTAAPMILVFATVTRRRKEHQRPFLPTGVFLSGYVVIWSGFALVATLANWGLHTGGRTVINGGKRRSCHGWLAADSSGDLPVE